MSKPKKTGSRFRLRCLFLFGIASTILFTSSARESGKTTKLQLEIAEPVASVEYSTLAMEEPSINNHIKAFSYSGPLLMPPLTTAQLKNKFQGMLLLGAYGDALGAPHELDSSSSGALRGCVGIPDTVLKLPPVGDYTASPWGVWVETKQGDDLRGLPTDDTSYRVTLLHQWLSQLARTDDAPTEARFLSWLRAEDKPNADAALWKTLRHRQISDWIVMFQDADRLRRDPSNFTHSDDNRFFRKDVPVVFGPFMYLELAAVDAGYPKQEVFTKFNQFSCLDQSYGKFITGLMAAMIAEAMSETLREKTFDEWFFETANDILESKLGDEQQRADVRFAFHAARLVGQDNRHLSEVDFLDLLKTEVFQEELPPLSKAQRGDMRSYDPLLFLKMMSAVVGYAGSDVRKSLRLLAVAPGDCDTMASQLGSIIGAWSGEDELRTINQVFASDLDQVQNRIGEQYGIKLSDLADRLTELAQRQSESTLTVTQYKPERASE